jgi:hypothetical protein
MRQTTLLTALLAFGSVTVFAADPQLLNMAPPDATTYAGINVEQAKTSPFVQFLLTQMPESNSLNKFITETGFDPRRDLTEVLIASTMPSASAVTVTADTGTLQAVPATDSHIMPGVVLAKGNFNIPQILGVAANDGEVVVSTYSGVTLLTINKNQALAFVDASTAVAGGLPGVKAALDRRSGSNSISPAIMARINQLSTTLDAWTVSTGALSSFIPGMGGPNGPSAVLSSITQASGGVKFGASIQVSVQAIAANAQDASSIGDLTKFAVQMISAQGNGANIPEALSTMLKSLVVSTDGTAVNVSLSMPEDELESLIKTSTSGAPAARI